MPRRSPTCLRPMGMLLFCLLQPFQANAVEPQPAPSAGQFAYYVLALSWSPTYCASSQQDREQCQREDRTKQYGLVLHGLWPQYAHGGYPSNCTTSHQLTQEAARAGASIYPSSKLMVHQWAKHGRCSGMDALRYFQTSDQARSRIQAPALLEAPRTPAYLPASAIASAVVQANPGMPPQAVIIRCRGTEFSEVRVCMDRSLQPTACTPNLRSNCRQGAIQVRGLP